MANLVALLFLLVVVVGSLITANHEAQAGNLGAAITITVTICVGVILLIVLIKKKPARTFEQDRQE